MANEAAKRGRKLQFPEKRETVFEPGTFKAISHVLGPNEKIAAFIRAAVSREIEHRSKAP